MVYYLFSYYFRLGMNLVLSVVSSPQISVYIDEGQRPRFNIFIGFRNVYEITCRLCRKIFVTDRIISRRA
jgi:hypothetical protein